MDNNYKFIFIHSDRSETARMLLELDDPAPAGTEDDSGQAAIVWMINKMPPVVRGLRIGITLNIWFNLLIMY